MDKLGFIITTISEKDSKTYMRETCFCRKGFLENRKNGGRKYGDVGRQALCSAGKKLGYVYASLSRFPQITKTNEKEIINFAYLLVRYIGGTYAGSAAHELDIKTRTFKMNLKEYVVCRHDGIGLVMTDGGIAGIWAWACADPSIEGVQIKCQGRGDDQCEVLCAPIEHLQNASKTLLLETSMPQYKFDEEYSVRNQIVDAIYSKNSVKTLLDAGFLEYKGGVMSYKGRRLFLDDAHVLFILEDEVCRLEGGSDVLFECAYDEGKEIAEAYKSSNWQDFITDYLSALGFGDIAVLDHTNPRVALINYPWTKLAKDSKYTIMAGLLSGIISKCTGKETKLGLLSTHLNSHLTITLGVIDEKPAA